MLDIDDLVYKQIIDKIDNSIVIKTATPLVDGEQTLTFCNQKYLRLYEVLTNDEGGFVVKSNNGTNVLISNFGTELKKGDVLYIPKPYYHRGTPRALNSEWSQISNDERNKLPAIWLLNPVDEQWNEYGDIERVSEIQLFIMCEADLVHDVTTDLRKKNVFPMVKLAQEIERSIKKNKQYFNPLNSYKTRDYSIFGSENTNGMIKQIIDSNLSALSMSFSLEVLKGNCNC